MEPTWTSTKKEAERTPTSQLLVVEESWDGSWDGARTKVWKERWDHSITLWEANFYFQRLVSYHVSHLEESAMATTPLRNRSWHTQNILIQYTEQARVRLPIPIPKSRLGCFANWLLFLNRNLCYELMSCCSCAVAHQWPRGYALPTTNWLCVWSDTTPETGGRQAE